MMLVTKFNTDPNERSLLNIKGSYSQRVLRWKNILFGSWIHSAMHLLKLSQATTWDTLYAFEEACII